jgi:hypothetical protein
MLSLLSVLFDVPDPCLPSFSVTFKAVLNQGETGHRAVVSIDKEIESPMIF